MIVKEKLVGGLMAKLSVKELIAFESDIADCFNKKMIKAPIHLYSNNEEKLINIFDSHIKDDDWVMCTWRSHYQCLLHGVPKEELKKAILEGKSITLAFPEYRILSSAIVGGILPIALGVALGIKRSGGTNKVIVFCGDMASYTGAFHEATSYACRNDLPILFVIEDNNLSVCTNTERTWGVLFGKNKVISYYYTNKYPHAGSGERIQF